MRCKQPLCLLSDFARAVFSFAPQTSSRRIRAALIVMTPKSLLRLPAASASVEQLTSGGFQPLIDDAEIAEPAAVERIILCSGKVFYDLNQARKKAGGDSTVRKGASEPGAVETGSPRNAK